MRVLLVAPLGVGNADQSQQLDSLLLDLGVLLVWVMGADGLPDLEADFEHRVQRGHRILEDQRDFVDPRTCRSSFFDIFSRSLPLNMRLAADNLARTVAGSARGSTSC